MSSLAKIGKFRVLRELGAGGFGAVYLCRDPFLDRDVAIKVFQVRDENIARLAVSESTDAGTVLKSRFVDEARILRDLGTSPYIVPVFDFDETSDGNPYYVMPYLADNLVGLIGKDAMDPAVIAELPKSERPRKLPLGRVLPILSQLLQALKEVHAARLVHRDIKPANILFNDKEEVQLCDFGIAKLPEGSWSQSGVALGSRDYMSPEQRESAKHVDARSDIYSVGVLAYRMLTGELPIGRYKDPIDHVAEIGKKLNALIIDCLGQRRESRPRDGGDLLARFDVAVSNPGSGDSVDDDATEVGAAPAHRPEAVLLGREIEAVLLEHGRLPSITTPSRAKHGRLRLNISPWRPDALMPLSGIFSTAAMADTLPTMSRTRSSAARRQGPRLKTQSTNGWAGPLIAAPNDRPASRTGFPIRPR